MADPFKNPFRPGAGQKPPHLAGRKEERETFDTLLEQDIVFKNMLLTGLRGTGKTVLTETFSPIAIAKGWLWVGTDLSESASVSEETLAIRLLTDLSVVTSNIVVARTTGAGFSPEGENIFLNYETLVQRYMTQPGLAADKLKATLEWAWAHIEPQGIRGVVFAYDEAQNMSDRPKDMQYPLSLLLDVFQSIQRKDIPFFLLLVGLPTLFPKLVSSRTYSERMFEVVELKSLTPAESRDAIKKPIEEEQCPVKFSEALIDVIVKQSGGYPYFIQFFSREVYDYYLSELARGVTAEFVNIGSIVAKLDTVFFAGRWSNITDRQREVMSVIAELPNCEGEFSIQEVAKATEERLEKPLGNSQINRMFLVLEEEGLMHKTRHGKYSLGIPLLAEFIRRQKVLG